MPNFPAATAATIMSAKLEGCRRTIVKGVGTPLLVATSAAVPCAVVHRDHFPAATAATIMSAKLEGCGRTIVKDVDHTIAGGDLRSCALCRRSP